MAERTDVAGVVARFGTSLASVVFRGVQCSSLVAARSAYCFDVAQPGEWSAPARVAVEVTADRAYPRVLAEAGGAQGPITFAAGAQVLARPDEGLTIVHGDSRVMVLTPEGSIVLTPGGPTTRLVVCSGGRWKNSVPPGLFALSLLQPLAQLGCCLLHAAVFRVAGQGVLAIGEGESGKTTLAMAALGAGGAVVSDDSAIVGVEKRGGVAGRFRRDFILRHPTVAILPPALRRMIAPVPWGNEVRYRLPGDVCGSSVGGTVRIDQVWLPTVSASAARSELSPCDAAHALANLVTGTASYLLAPFFPVESSGIMAVLVALVSSSRCFKVRLGTDLMRSPAETVLRLVEAGMGQDSRRLDALGLGPNSNSSPHA